MSISCADKKAVNERSNKDQKIKQGFSKRNPTAKADYKKPSIIHLKMWLTR